MPVSRLWKLYPWWRHQMETFAALLALCVGSSPVTSKFPSQKPATRSLDFFFICARTNGWVSNRYAGAFRRHRRYDVTVMCIARARAPGMYNRGVCNSELFKARTCLAFRVLTFTNKLSISPEPVATMNWKASHSRSSVARALGM